MNRSFPLLTALVLAAALPARAQDGDRYPLGRAKVEDNRQAADLYDRALAQLEAGRWREGVERLLELQDQWGDKLILHGEPGQYVSARALIVKLTKAMSPDALAAYRAAVDPRVERRVRDAVSPEALRAVLRDAPMSTFAPEAARRLGNLLADGGDVAGAAAAWTSLLELPGRSQDALAAGRLALCLGSLNDREGLAALEARMAGRLDDAVLLRGKPSTLRAAFAAARNGCGRSTTRRRRGRSGRRWAGRRRATGWRPGCAACPPSTPRTTSRSAPPTAETRASTGSETRRPSRTPVRRCSRRRRTGSWW
jgi:hypothetical protein